MDREEAIKILQEEIDGNLELSLREWRERDEQRLFPALRMAIEALSAEPTDLISRADAVKSLPNGTCYDSSGCVNALKNLPSAERPNIAYICDGTACDGACDECHHTTDIEHAKNFKNVGGKYIEESDRPSGEWTPVSEGLPKEPYGCFVTVMDSFFNGCDWDDVEYLLPYFVGYDGESWNDADGKVLLLEVLAWMPLPKPYCPNCGAKMGGGVK